MPGLSRTILARRSENAPDELLFPRFDGKTISKEDCIWLSIPALVYQIEVKELVDTNNVFVYTVTQLAKIKRREIRDNGKLYDYIAEKTGLSRILVKSILQDESLHQDVESGEKKEESVRKLKYLVYNPVSETFFPRLLSVEEFDISTRSADVYSDGGVDLSFRLKEAQGWKRAFQLYTDEYSEDRTLRNPIQLLERIPGLRARLFKNSDIDYTGQCTLVNAICYLFRSDTDLTTLHLSNPTNGDNVDAMIPAILNMARKYPTENEELLNRITSLDEDRKELFDEIGDWNQQIEEQEQEILFQYPKLFAYSPILRRVASIHQNIDDDNCDNLIVAFHEFMEDIFLLSLQRNEPTDDDQWDDYIKRKESIENSTGDICDLLVGFADEIGLIAADEDRSFALKCFALKKDNKKKEENSQLVISDYQARTYIASTGFPIEIGNSLKGQDVIEELLTAGSLSIGVQLALSVNQGNGNGGTSVCVIGPDGRRLGMLPSPVSVVLASRMQRGEQYTARVVDIADDFRHTVSIEIEGINASGNGKKKNTATGFLRKGQLLKALQDANSVTSSSTNLPELLAANIIQAITIPKHPFRHIRGACPDIIATVYTSMNYRNHAKHDDDEKRALVAQLTHEVIWRTTDALLKAVLDVDKLSGTAVAKEKRRQLGEQKARQQAEEQIQYFPATAKLYHEHLHKVLKAFFFRGGNYFVKCDVLLSDVLSEVLSEETEREQRKRTANTFFQGISRQDAAQMEALFTDIGCRYQTEDIPNTAKIKKNWNYHSLTLKNKMFLCYATLKHYNPKFLEQLVKVAPDFPMIVDMVCRKREHNKQADFTQSADGYLTFNADLLSCCEQICLILRNDNQEEE